MEGGKMQVELNYRCLDCLREFKVKVSHGYEAPIHPKCPQCNSRNSERQY